MSLLTVYLDTCIVIGLVKEDLANEQAATDKILECYGRGNVSLKTSHIAKEELKKASKNLRSKQMRIYHLLSKVPEAREFRGSRGPSGLGLGTSSSAHPSLHLMLKKLIELLHGKSDARHVFQAAMNRMQYFLTTDYDTILKYRQQIRQISRVEAVSPTELLEILKEIESIDA